MRRASGRRLACGSASSSPPGKRSCSRCPQPGSSTLPLRAEDLGFDSVWVGDSLTARPRLEPLALLAAHRDADDTCHYRNRRADRVTATHGTRRALHRDRRSARRGAPRPRPRRRLPHGRRPSSSSLRQTPRSVAALRSSNATSRPGGGCGATLPHRPHRGSMRRSRQALGAIPPTCPSRRSTAVARGIRTEGAGSSGPVVRRLVAVPAHGLRIRCTACRGRCGSAGRRTNDAGRVCRVRDRGDRRPARSGVRAAGSFLQAYYGFSGETLRLIQAVVAGSPEACAEQLCEYVAAGADHLVLRLGDLAGTNLLGPLAGVADRVRSTSSQTRPASIKENQ